MSSGSVVIGNFVRSRGLCRISSGSSSHRTGGLKLSAQIQGELIDIKSKAIPKYIVEKAIDAEITLFGDIPDRIAFWHDYTRSIVKAGRKFHRELSSGNVSANYSPSQTKNMVFYESGEPSRVNMNTLKRCAKGFFRCFICKEIYPNDGTHKFAMATSNRRCNGCMSKFVKNNSVRPWANAPDMK